MIAPRRLVIEAARGPEIVVPPGTGGGPGRLVDAEAGRRAREVGAGPAIAGRTEPAAADRPGRQRRRQRTVRLRRGLASASWTAFGTGSELAASAGAAQVAARPCRMPRPGRPGSSTSSTATTSSCSWKARTCGRSSSRSSTPVRSAAFQKSVEPYREYFYNEVIGRFDIRCCRPTRGRARATKARSGPATKWCWTCFPTCSPTACCWCPRT